MWALNNRTPFAAERTFQRDRDGAEVWVVAVRGTFRIRPDGSLGLAEEQVPVALCPDYLGERGRSSLRYETDLVLRKAQTDVLLLGHAHAPERRPVQELEVALEVGPIRKRLRVVGDRRWRAGALGLRLGEPEPFLRMPLVYERAFGGLDPEDASGPVHLPNPVGTGFARSEAARLGSLEPNLLPLDGDLRRTVGFGPIDRGWEPRLGHAGTFDKRWEQERLPLVPEDFDEAFHQCAPADQQAPLRGGERLRVHHLVPPELGSSGTLELTLPKVRLAFRTQLGRREVEHRAKLHTVILEADEGRLQMVWHTHLPCHQDVHRLHLTTIDQKYYV